MADRKLGVVVVGVGRAGRARISDLVKCEQFEETKGATLIGYVSRRDLDIEGAKQLPLEDALSREDVHVIIVCTENSRHEEIARRGLEAGKHVLVEFPLAVSCGVARELYALADKQNVTLYEEDISLLLDSFKSLRALMKQKPRVTEGRTGLEGTFNGWIEDMEASGSPFHSSVSQLHRLLLLFDGIQASDAHIVQKDKFQGAYAQLRTAQDGLITMSLEREVLEAPKRSTTFCYKFEDGSDVDNTSFPAPVRGANPGQPGLFMKDFIQFLKVLKKDIAGEEFQKLTLDSLQLADELYEMAKRNPKSQL